MKRSFSFKSRILLTFSLIIALFTAGIIYFERQQVIKERTRGLERMLDNNAQTIAGFLRKNRLLNKSDTVELSKLLGYMQPDLRVTLIDRGEVIYDNRLDVEALENHLMRPEIQESLKEGTGTNIRKSASNQVEYLYYVRPADDFFVRVALPYNVELRSFIHSGNSFAFYILLFFIVSVLMMIYFPIASHGRYATEAI